MPAAAVLLVLIAALLHAAWNIAAKKAGGDHRFVLMGALLVAVRWAPLGIWMGWDQVPRWRWAEWALVLASGVTHLVYFNVLLKGYRASDLTVVYHAARMAPLSHVAPAREVSMLFAALLGGKLLGESDRGLRLLGAAAIALGVVALAAGA